MGSKKDKSKDKVRLEFIGGNANGVTGSSILGSFKGVNFLLELGMIQGFGSKIDTYRANWDILNRIDFSKIDYIFIGHFHMDHASLIPNALTHKDFHGKIICTTETARMLKPLLEDSAKIINEDCEWLKNSRGVNAKEYYKDIHANRIFDYICEYDTNELYSLNNFLSFKLIPNNHVLGSCSLKLYFKDDLGKKKSIFYSSDLGNTNVDKFFVYDNIKQCTKANIAIFESTYGGNNKKPITAKMRKNDLREMKNQIIYTLLEKQGNVIFPSFAADRQENLLVYIKQIIDSDERLKDIPVVVDGKLSSKIINVYKDALTGEQKELFDDILNWQNLKINATFEQTQMCLADSNPKIILSSSGMCEAGRIREYLKRCLPDKKSTVIFTGFAPANSLGGKLKLHEHNTIAIDKKNYRINADIVSLNSFSSHMQKNALLDYCLSMNVSDKYIFVHGDKEEKANITQELKDELSIHNKTTEVLASKKGMVVYL